MLNRPVRLLGCACVLAALALAGACTPVAAAAGLGGGNSFNELTEGASEEATGATSAKTAEGESPGSSTSSSGTGTVLLLSLIAAGVLLAGIAFVIVRDAHRVAPVPEGQLGVSGRSARDAAVQMRKRRAKAKAARRQRKRNR